MSKDNEDLKENPFSFRNFLTNQVNSPNSSRTSSGISSHYQSRSTAENADFSGNNAHLNDAFEDTSRSSQSRKHNSDKEENPYSFKRFLCERDNGGASTPGMSSRKQRGDEVGVLSHGDLPDFVQDHFGAESLGAAACPPLVPVGLPDFGLPTGKETITGVNHSTTPSSSPHLGGSSSLYRSRHVSADLISGNGVDHDQFNNELLNGTNVAPHPPGSSSNRRVLPDFLSDSGVGCLPCVNIEPNHTGLEEPVNGNMDRPVLPRGGSVSSASCHMLQIERLNQEKNNLLNELAEKDNQLERLRRRLRDKETREADETAAMEKILKQVETNLQSANERASRAEQQVKKLKEENKQLRSQIQVSESSLNDSNSSLVSTRARQLGKDLAHASIEAETLLKQLLTGVDKVKLLSDTLQSLDKFSEYQPQSN